MRQRPNHPTLVAIDFHNLTCRRYWPKPGDQRPATFITQTGQLQKPDDQPWKMGAADGLALLEDFRVGKLNVHNEDGTEAVA